MPCVVLSAPPLQRLRGLILKHLYIREVCLNLSVNPINFYCFFVMTCYNNSNELYIIFCNAVKATQNLVATS